MTQPVLRFAPSPNGALHLGHALSALTGYELARRLGGRFLLRIEDIDRERCREEHVADLCRDLAWLGISWEEPVLRQSEHFASYRAAADRLTAMGMLYPCFASRKEIAAAARTASGGCRQDPDGADRNPGLHRHLSADEVARRLAQGELAAQRLHMDRAVALARAKAGGEIGFTELHADLTAGPIQCRPERWGDAVIVRKEWPTSYHLAVVVDDARQGITHVTRGLDLLAATDLHRVLQILLDLPEPMYRHHELIRDAAGRKLSKSAGDTSLAALRSSGATPGDIRRLVGLG